MDNIQEERNSKTAKYHIPTQWLCYRRPIENEHALTIMGL